MNKTIIVLVVVVLILIVGYLLLTQTVSTPSELETEEMAKGIAEEGMPVEESDTEEMLAEEVRVISMRSGGFFFEPNVLNLKLGQPVRLEITSQGAHTFTVDEWDINVALEEGEVNVIEFTPDTAGTFEFYCAVPGHRESGQVGMIIVE